jgi:hypothetical protein
MKVMRAVNACIVGLRLRDSKRSCGCFEVTFLMSDLRLVVMLVEALQLFET